MTRKAAFGNKKKKEQLQLQRQKKREKPEREAGNDIPFVEDAVRPPGGDDTFDTRPHVVIARKKGRPSAEEKKEASNRIHPALKKLPADLRTVFEAESRVVVDARKKASEDPIVRGKEEELRTQDTNMYSAVIDLPVRPPWTCSMSVEQIEENERRYFEKWIRQIYTYPKERLNYFEHNIEVWRQLWRVCEMSDVLVLVADIRHPLFHFPPSLYAYVVEYHKKPLLLLLNKIDLVSSERVAVWKEYFERTYPHLGVIPFSTHTEMAHTVNEFTKKHKRAKKGKLSARYLGARGGAGLIDAVCRLAFPKDEVPLTKEEMEVFEYRPPAIQPENERGASHTYQQMPGRHFVPPQEEEDDEDEGSDEDELLSDEEEPLSLNEVEQQSRGPRPYRVIGMIGHPNVGKSYVTFYLDHLN